MGNQSSSYLDRFQFSDADRFCDQINRMADIVSGFDELVDGLDSGAQIEVELARATGNLQLCIIKLTNPNGVAIAIKPREGTEYVTVLGTSSRAGQVFDQKGSTIGLHEIDGLEADLEEIKAALTERNCS